MGTGIGSIAQAGLFPHITSEPSEIFRQRMRSYIEMKGVDKVACLPASTKALGRLGVSKCRGSALAEWFVISITEYMLLTGVT
jgi:hypothetical protein